MFRIGPQKSKGVGLPPEDFSDNRHDIYGKIVTPTAQPYLIFSIRIIPINMSFSHID